MRAKLAVIGTKLVHLYCLGMKPPDGYQWVYYKRQYMLDALLKASENTDKIIVSDRYMTNVGRVIWIHESIAALLRLHSQMEKAGTAIELDLLLLSSCV